jgi:hypothetical protein
MQFSYFQPYNAEKYRREVELDKTVQMVYSGSNIVQFSDQK